MVHPPTLVLYPYCFVYLLFTILTLSNSFQVHDHHWPIEKWSIDLQEFVTRDPYFPGYYGSVQER